MWSSIVVNWNSQNRECSCSCFFCTFFDGPGQGSSGAQNPKVRFREGYSEYGVIRAEINLIHFLDKSVKSSIICFTEIDLSIAPLRAVVKSSSDMFSCWQFPIDRCEHQFIDFLKNLLHSFSADNHESWRFKSWVRVDWHILLNAESWTSRHAWRSISLRWGCGSVEVCCDDGSAKSVSWS